MKCKNIPPRKLRLAIVLRRRDRRPDSESQRTPGRMLLAVRPRILLCFFLSGLTALIYQILWTRRLSLTFGHTVLAVSTVLTVFMAGLAIGSLAAGYWSDSRQRQPLAYFRAYGIVEGFVGVWAVLSLGLLSMVEQGYFALARSGVEGTGLHLACFAGAFLVLFPPTLAMGASLPLISKMLILEERSIGSLLSQIYGVNTMGAFAGASLGGFVLLPSLGLRASMVLAGGLNIGIGAYAFWQARRLWTLAENQIQEKSEQVEESTGEPASGSILVPAVFGMAGAASMICQVGWTRGLVLSFGSSIYCFSLILAAFLAGLGLGSLLYGRMLGGRRPAIAHLIGLQLMIAALGAVLLFAIGRLPLLGAFLVSSFGHNYASLVAVQFVVVFLLFLLPTVAMGMAFPLATHLYNSQISGLGKTLGQVYGANTLGCILGSFAAGFWLIPQLGSQQSLKIAVFLYLLNAIVLYLGFRPSQGISPVAGRARLAAFVALVFAATWLNPPWDTRLMAAGASISRKTSESLEQATPLAFYQDGLSCTVAVGYNAPWKPFLKVNGKADAAVHPADMVPMYLIGYLPGVYHAQPREVAVVGFGAGFTIDALTDIPSVERILCAELEPAVMAAEKFFTPFNGAATKDPRVEIKLTDGRTFLMGSSQKFDVIVNQPSNPWIAGVGNLFSKEFYAACRQRLKPGGIMCQWSHVYSTSADDFRQIVRTFFSEYPHGAVFRFRGDLILIGSETPLDFPLERIKESVNWDTNLAANLVEIGIFDPQILLGFYGGDRDTMLGLAGPGPLNTDDLPLLEYSAPKSLFVNSAPVLDLLSNVAPLLPSGVTPTDDRIFYSLLGKTKASVRLPLEEAKKQLSGQPSPLYDYLALLAAIEDPAADSKPQPRWETQSPQAALEVGNWFLQNGQPSESLRAFEQVLKAPFPGSQYRASLGAGDAARLLQRPQVAASFYERAASHTLSSEPLVKLAKVQSALGNQEQALATLEQAIQRHPYDFQAYVDRAWIALEQNRREAAQADFTKATELGGLGPSWEELARRLRSR